MKKVIITVFTVFLVFQFSFSQTDLNVEKIKIFTDRDLYITGENILLSVFIISAGNNKTSDSLSKIVYVELFDKNQKSIIKRKIKLIKMSSELYIKIPKNLDTDNYILTAYTRYQKLYCQNLTSGKLISIINPNYVRFDSDTKAKYSKLNNKIAYNGVKISIKTNKYKTRKKVNLNINFNDINRPKTYKYVLSVVRKGTIKNISQGINFQKDLVTENFPKSINEKRICISGILTNKTNGNPIQGKEIYLSGLKSEKQIHAIKTDNKGNFNFFLYNFNGIKDFYLTTEPGVNNSKILILNEFLNSCIPIEKTELHLFENEKSLIEEMYLNQQLSDLKGCGIKYTIHKTDTLISQFGKPDYKIYLKNFVKLPTLHEVFDEIIPSVRVREENKQFVLSIYDEELNINYNKPLILLDNIPVFNVDDILKIKPSQINNIEIINKMYLSGDKIYNGIIILNSNSDKFCRIKLPENSKFIKYQGFAYTGHPFFPEYKTIDEKESNMPDFRNTLYWKSGNLPTKENSVLSFYTSDNCGEYTINLYLIDEKGNVIKKSKTFIVEK